MEFPAAGDLEPGSLRLLFQRHVGLEFFLQPVGDLPRGTELAFLTSERRGVRPDEDLQRRGFDLHYRQRFGLVGARDGLADLYAVDAGQLDDLSRSGVRSFGPAEPFGHEDFLDFGGRGFAVRSEARDRVAFLDSAALDAPDRIFTLERVPGQGGDEHLEGCRGISRRRRHVLDDRFEDRGQVALRRGWDIW